MRRKTISEIRSEAGLKSGAVRKALARRDPLTTVSIRRSSHQALRTLADQRGATMTETLHDLITGASTGLASTGLASTGRV